MNQININVKLIKKHFGELIKTPSYLIPVLLTVLSSYFYFCTHISIGIDDLTTPRYMSGELLAQGRFTGQLIDFVLPFDSIEVLYNFIGIFLYALSAVFFCLLFRILLFDESTNMTKYTFFSCIFISYPITIEIFCYHGLPFAIGGNTILILITIFLILSKIKFCMVFSTIFLAFSCAWHEGEIPVYVCAVFAILLICTLNDTEQKYTIFQVIKSGIPFALPLVLGFLLKIIIGNIFCFFLDLEKSTISENTILYTKYGIHTCIENMIHSLKYEFVLKAGVYLPITILFMAIGISFLLCTIYAIKKKSIVCFLLNFCLIMSLFLLSIIQGTITPYRASQVFTFFVAFIFFLSIHLIHKKTIKKFFCCLLTILIINQIILLNNRFELDYQRSQTELALISEIGYELESKYNLDKPVVFIGYYELSKQYKDKLYISSNSKWVQLLNQIHPITDLPDNDIYWYPIHQTYCNSVISWGIFAFDEVNTELLRVFSYCGYDLKQGTIEMYNDAITHSTNKKGITIKDCNEYILVNINN